MLTDEWSRESFIVNRDSPEIAVGERFVLDLAYETAGPPSVPLCQYGQWDEDMRCRLPAGHDSPHVPFSGELVRQSGVYATRIRSKGAQC